MPVKFVHFMELVDRAVTLLPKEFFERMTNVTVFVAQEPDVATLKSLGISDQQVQDGESLYGLFEPLLPDVEDPLMMGPYRVTLFKGPLERDFPERRQLMIEVRKTLIHEIAHHFGLSDDDMTVWDECVNPFAQSESWRHYAPSRRRLPKALRRVRKGKKEE